MKNHLFAVIGLTLGTIISVMSPNSSIAAQIAYYDFENSSVIGGALQNLQNPGNSDGVLTGSITTGVAGIAGQAFQFNGTGAALDLGTGVVRTQVEGTEPWSISAWVNINSTAAAEILYRRESTEAEGGLRLNAGGNPSVFVQADDGSSTSLNSATALTIGEWAHVVGIREPFPGSDWRLYVDGVEQSGPGTSFSLAGPALTPQIGRDLNGLLDELRVYDHALSAEEVTALFEAGTPASAISAPGAVLLFSVSLISILVRRRRAHTA